MSLQPQRADSWLLEWRVCTAKTCVRTEVASIVKCCDTVGYSIWFVKSSPKWCWVGYNTILYSTHLICTELPFHRQPSTHQFVYICCVTTYYSVSQLSSKTVDSWNPVHISNIKADIFQRLKTKWSLTTVKSNRAIFLWNSTIIFFASPQESPTFVSIPMVAPTVS